MFGLISEIGPRGRAQLFQAIEWRCRGRGLIHVTYSGSTQVQQQDVLLVTLEVRRKLG